jgi:hypothetical protein
MRVRELNQNSRAIAQKRIVTRGASMAQVFQDLKTLFDYAVTLSALYVGYEADTAGIVFETRLIEALFSGRSIQWRIRLHGAKSFYP